MKSAGSLFFVEITCQTNPAPGKISLGDVPRIAKMNQEVEMALYPDGRLVEQRDAAGCFRELQVLQQFKDLQIVTDGSRWFLGFNNVNIKDYQEFYNFAKSELANYDRIIAALLTKTYPIQVLDNVYVAEHHNGLTQIVGSWDINTLNPSPIIYVFSDDQTISQWHTHIQNVLEEKGLSLTLLLELSRKDIVVAACVQNLSENTFVSYYRAYETLRAQFGGQANLIKMGFADKKEISRFTNNAQVFRHSERTLDTQEMPVGEAKLFIIRLLKFYLVQVAKIDEARL